MISSATDGIERFYAPNRAEWRAWLEAHHSRSRGVWLIYYKKGSGKPRVDYADAVEEALCFGWIDSRPNALDDERYVQHFSPRKPRSPWSKINKERAERMIRDGRMHPVGLAAIEAAKRGGFWNSYDSIEEQTVPEDLASALAANPGAERSFAAFSGSTKKQLLWHITSAKRPETRAKRIAQIVAAAAEGRNPLAYVPPDKR